MLREPSANSKEPTKLKISAITAGLAAGTLVIGVAGCGSDKSSSPSSSSTPSSAGSSAAASSATPSSSSAAAQPGDYSGLLIKPTDIVVPGDTFTLTQTLPVPNPAGVEGVFMNQGRLPQTRRHHLCLSRPRRGGAARSTRGAKCHSPRNEREKGPATPVDVGTGRAAWSWVLRQTVPNRWGSRCSPRARRSWSLSSTARQPIRCNRTSSRPRPQAGRGHQGGLPS